MSLQRLALECVLYECDRELVSAQISRLYNEQGKSLLLPMLKSSSDILWLVVHSARLFMSSIGERAHANEHMDAIDAYMRKAISSSSSLCDNFFTNLFVKKSLERVLGPDLWCAACLEFNNDYHAWRHMIYMGDAVGDADSADNSMHVQCFAQLRSTAMSALPRYLRGLHRTVVRTSSIHLVARMLTGCMAAVFAERKHLKRRLSDNFEMVFNQIIAVEHLTPLQDAFGAQRHLLPADADSIDGALVYSIVERSLIQRKFNTMYASSISFYSSYWQRTRHNQDSYELFFDIPRILELYARFSTSADSRLNFANKRQRIH